ncbi:MAG TPA: helix-turn-helix domain-containing protein, partial [Mycobacteriales bacterium]
MRADALRNSELLLQAARDVFVERGPDASLEEIARRAGVGIATLYRRFGDRQALMHAVVHAALVASAEAAEHAQREHADPFDALTAYVHAVLDLRTSAVIPVLLDRLDLAEPELDTARRRSASIADRLLTAAHRAGAVRKDVTFGDIGLMLVRLSRPLPGQIPPETQDALAHRHAELLLRGLRAVPSDEPLPGSGLELAQLRRLRRHAPTTG